MTAGDGNRTIDPSGHQAGSATHCSLVGPAMFT